MAIETMEPTTTVEVEAQPRTIEERVRAGALMLDEFRPGWYQDVNLDRLDMGQGHTCVLGQLYKSYGGGVAKIYGQGSGNGQATRHGFWHSYMALPSWSEERLEYKAMTAAWSEEITRRRSGV